MRIERVIILAVLICGAKGGASDNVPDTQPTTESLRSRLDRSVAEFQFDGTIEAAVDLIREKYHFNMNVNWHSLANDGISPAAKVKIHMWDVQLGQVIHSLFIIAGQEGAGIDLEMDGDVLTISSTAGGPQPAGNIEIYDVRDLLDAAVSRRKSDAAQTKSADVLQEEESNNLRSLVQEMVDHDTWAENGGSAIIQVWSGRLFVRQLPVQQRHVADFLEMIRKQDDHKSENRSAKSEASSKEEKQ